MADNTRGGSQDGANPLIATDEVTYSGDTADVQLFRPVNVTGAEGARTVDAITTADGQFVQGSVAHDAADAGNPVKIGGKADDGIPAAVADGDRVDAWFGTNGQQVVSINSDSSLGYSAVPGDAQGNAENALHVVGRGQVFNGTTWDRARGDITNGLDVDVTRLPALPTGTNNIGDVDVLTMPNVTLAAGTNTNEVVGDIAHDTGVGGNPVQVAGAAQDMDDTAPPNRVSAEADVTRFATDRDGTQFVHPHGPQIWSYHLDTSSAQTDTTVHASPGSGLSLYVTDIVFSSGAATAINLFFEEGSTKVLGPYYLEATAGRGMALHFNTPKKITAATALTLTTSAAIAHTVDVTGWVGQG